MLIRNFEKLGLDYLKKVKPMLSDLNTYLSKVCIFCGIYSQTGCSFDGNSAMLWRNVPILMGSLLDTTCNSQFKFAQASYQVPVFDIPVLKVIIPPLFQRNRK